MKRTLLCVMALGAALACGNQRSGPVGVGPDAGSLTGPTARVSGGGTFFGLPIARDPIAVKVLGTGIRRLEGGDVQRLLKEGRLTADEARLAGGICPVLMDCWWTDEEEFFMDPLLENYTPVIPGAPRVGVILFKVGGPADPCPYPPGAPMVLTVAFTACDFGKTGPFPLAGPAMPIPLGPLPVGPGTFIGFFFIGPLPPGLYDSFFVMDWDGTGLIPVDDACGIDFWESPSGGPPPLILQVFGPEPPFPPGGWPPGRLPGEDGETRPWCLGF